MPRYVILEHDHPVLHWDFMLEIEGVLRTWRLSAPPEKGRTIAAEAIGDHRLDYLDYEGPVSGNRGVVKAWDRGTYWREAEVPERQGQIVVRLRGTRCSGSAILIPNADGSWTVRFSAHEGERQT